MTDTKISATVSTAAVETLTFAKKAIAFCCAAGLTFSSASLVTFIAGCWAFGNDDLVIIRLVAVSVFMGAIMTFASAVTRIFCSNIWAGSTVVGSVLAVWLCSGLRSAVYNYYNEVNWGPMLTVLVFSYLFALLCNFLMSETQNKIRAAF